MNNIKYISLVIIIVTLFSSCKQKEKSEALIIDLNKTTNVSVFDFFETVKIIPLETTDECLIKSIDRLIKYENKIFILDRSSQIVFCFRENGDFLYKIDKKGRGPEEYDYLSNFGIDSYNNYLLLLEPFGVLHRYQLDGKFVMKNRLPNKDKSAYNEVFAINLDTLVFQSLGDYQILYYSVKNDTIFKSLFPEIGGIPTNLSRTFEYNGNIVFYTLYENELLNLTKLGKKVGFKWDFGSENNSSSEIKKSIDFGNDLNSGKIHYKLAKTLVGSYLKSLLWIPYENNEWRYALVEFKNDLYNVFVNKRTNEQYVFTHTEEGLSFKRAFISNGYFIKSSELLKEHNPNGDFLSVVEKIAPEYSDIVKNHNPAVDNPFLILYKLKNE